MKMGFIGAGNMGEALASGAIKNGVVQARDVYLYDVAVERLNELAGALGALATASPEDVVLHSDVVVFAVKPQNMPDLLAGLAASSKVQRVLADRFFISICAGVRLATIENGLGRNANTPTPRVARVMPNTPALIGEGAAGVAAGVAATDADIAVAEKMMNAVGMVARVEEEHLDAVTAVSGSGPAYVFRFIEALESAAKSVGLAPDVARALTLQTVQGAARMASEQAAVDTAELRRRVTSPGGTTAAGLAVLEERAFVEAIEACVQAATERGRELANLAENK